nr:hypothetical protein [Tanacetum cinerariifolium]
MNHLSAMNHTTSKWINDADSCNKSTSEARCAVNAPDSFGDQKRLSLVSLISFCDANNLVAQQVSSLMNHYGYNACY